MSPASRAKPVRRHSKRSISPHRPRWPRPARRRSRLPSRARGADWVPQQFGFSLFSPEPKAGVHRFEWRTWIVRPMDVLGRVPWLGSADGALPRVLAARFAVAMTFLLGATSLAVVRLLMKSPTGALTVCVVAVSIASCGFAFGTVFFEGRHPTQWLDWGEACTTANASVSCCGSTGFTKWWANPAASDRIRSSA